MSVIIKVADICQMQFSSSLLLLHFTLSKRHFQSKTTDCLQIPHVCNLSSLHLSSSVDLFLCTKDLYLFGHNDDPQDEQGEGPEPERAEETEHKWALRAKTLRDVCIKVIAEELLTVHTYSV